MAKNLELQQIIKSNICKDIVFVCIGSEKHVWDSIGPFIGTFIKELGYKDVYGVIGNSANSDTIEFYRDYIYKHYSDPYIIAVDAAITENKFEHRTLIIQQGGLTPGSAVGKSIKKIGDLSILINIYAKSFHENKNIASPYELAKDIAIFINKNIIRIINQEENKMKKCKYCGGTDFFAEVTETVSYPVKISNNEVVEVYEDQKESAPSGIRICFCCGCEKAITEDDIILVENCSICGKESDTLFDGKCECCANVLNGIDSPEKLLAKILSGEISLPNMNMQQEAPVKDKAEKSDKKSDKKSAKKEKPIKEPKEVKEEEVKTAKNVVNDKVVDAPLPTSATKSSSSEAPIIDTKDDELEIPIVDNSTEVEAIEPLEPDTDLTVESLMDSCDDDWDF